MKDIQLVYQPSGRSLELSEIHKKQNPVLNETKTHHVQHDQAHGGVLPILGRSARKGYLFQSLGI